MNNNCCKYLTGLKKTNMQTNCIWIALSLSSISEAFMPFAAYFIKLQSQAVTLGLGLTGLLFTAGTGQATIW